MKKRIIAVVIVAALLVGFFVLPNVSFAQSGSFDEALSSYNNAISQLKSELPVYKSKVQQVQSLSREVRELLKEKKENGETLSDSVKADVKKLMALHHRAERERDIKEARAFYSKHLLTEIKNLKEQIKEKKQNGASKDELKPLIEKEKTLLRKMRNVAPASPEFILKNSDKVVQKAEELNKNGKTKEAIKLLDGATRKVNIVIKIMKSREDKMNKLIELLNKVKGELG
jgi:chromosome segregation ATPase